MVIEQSQITVDGQEYVWWVSRQPQWCTTDGWQGIQITVELANSVSKTLLIQLPMPYSTRHSTPQKQRPKVSSSQVAGYITQAIQAGWVPDSKGKPFKYAAN